MGFYINLSFKQIESINMDLRSPKNESLKHIWIHAETGEFSHNKLEGNWKQIDVTEDLKSEFNDFYINLQKFNIQNDTKYPLDFSKIKTLFKPEKFNQQDLYLKSLEIFGDFYTERLLNASDSKSMNIEIYKIAKELLEGIKPLKDDKIILIHELLKGVDNSLEHEFPFDVKAMYGLLNDSIQSIILKQEGIGKIPITSNVEGQEIKGNNHSYFLTNKAGEKLWVFKPESGESSQTGLEGVKSGEGAKKEQVASLVNYHQKFPIPFTAYVNIGGQVGSVQLFIQNAEPLSEIRSCNRAALNLIEVNDLQYIMVYDLMFGNCDGHSGNVLCLKNELGSYKLFSIDHGATLSTSYKDLLVLEYMDLKPIALTPLQSEVKEFIKNFDIKMTCGILEAHGVSQEAIDWHNLVGECLKSQLNYENDEINSGDIAFVLMKGREMILQSSKRIEKFDQLLNEVIKFKRVLKGMNLRKELTEKKVLDLRETMGKSIKSKGNYLSQDFEWLKQLFLLIGKNYCKHLSNNELIIDFY